MKALLVVDVQKGLMRGKIYNKNELVTTINLAISRYEENEDCVISIQHNSKMLVENTPEWEMDDGIRFQKDHERFQKVHGNGFEKTGLKDYLARKFINEVLVCGLVSHGCVKATCMGALEAGFKASILKNGHSCWSSDAKDKIGQVERELELLGIHSVNV